MSPPATSLMRRQSLGSRMHARAFLVAVLLLALWLLCDAHVVLLAEAKDCVTKNPATMMAWKHGQGSFECVNCLGTTADAVNAGAVRRQWREYDRERKLLNLFVEEMREGLQVVLRDDSRDIAILLRSDLCGIRTGNEQNFRQLYGGGFMSVIDCT
ncbi:hypothetical protein N2W54_001908 [Lotmaria passim]